MWILYGYPPTNKIPREPHGIQRLQSMLQLPQWILLVVIIVVVVVVVVVVIVVVMIVEVVVILVVRRGAGTRHKRLNHTVSHCTVLVTSHYAYPYVRRCDWPVQAVGEAIQETPTWRAKNTKTRNARRAVL